MSALQQFLAALKAKDFEGAKVLAFRSMLQHPLSSMLPSLDRLKLRLSARAV